MTSHCAPPALIHLVELSGKHLSVAHNHAWRLIVDMINFCAMNLVAFCTLERVQSLTDVLDVLLETRVGLVGDDRARADSLFETVNVAVTEVVLHGYGFWREYERQTCVGYCSSSLCKRVLVIRSPKTPLFPSRKP